SLCSARRARTSVYSLPAHFSVTDTATPVIYTLSLHDALPISRPPGRDARGMDRRLRSPRRHPRRRAVRSAGDSVALSARPRKMRSEEHTSELQSRFDLVCRLLLDKKNAAAVGEGTCLDCGFNG